MKSLKAKGRTCEYGPHTSVILPALGSLPSVALSSGRMHVNYMIKKVLQGFFYNFNILLERKTGILIVAERK
jgi:hypothetical protein